MAQARVIEQSFYDPLMAIIREHGGKPLQEPKYITKPDIEFILAEQKWILSVKIGATDKIRKDAFIQYMRHKEDSGIKYGMIVHLPESARNVRPDEESVYSFIRTTVLDMLIDADLVKEDISDKTFSDVMVFIKNNVIPNVRAGMPSAYPLSRVISLLQQQVTEMMTEIDFDQDTILKVITNRNLLMDLGAIHSPDAEPVGRFLASYIFMSQIMFLRLLSVARPDIVTAVVRPASANKLRRAFRQILKINYKSIYETDILDAIPADFLKDTFDLIWGLEIEKIKHELPGRIFHELMPGKIRKILAAFYTRPHAADLLAQLTIQKSNDMVFDPASGSGTILVSAYRQKKRLFDNEGIVGNPHARFAEEELIGADIMPFAVHLTSANIASMDPGTTIGRTQIIQGDSLKLRLHRSYSSGLQVPFAQMEAHPVAEDVSGEGFDVSFETADVILMNPPFTRIERGIREFVSLNRFKEDVGSEVSLWGHFVKLADLFLKNEGVFGAVIPINVLRGRESEKVRRLLFRDWTPLFIVKPTMNYAFSESAQYRDILFVAKKKTPNQDSKVKFAIVKKDLTKLTDDDVFAISELIQTETRLRNSSLVDIDTYPVSDLLPRFENLMWFCSGTDFGNRDIVSNFVERACLNLKRFPQDQKYCQNGLRTDGGRSKILFLNRELSEDRVAHRSALLKFNNDKDIEKIKVRSQQNATFEIEQSALVPGLRTSICLKSMDLANQHDYVAIQPYHEIKRVAQAANVKNPELEFWRTHKRSVESMKSRLVISHRINPTSPSTHLIAFYSETPVVASNSFNVIHESDSKRARALCAIFNSIIFLSQFFLLKEESGGRFINVQPYDMRQMWVMPHESAIGRLSDVFDEVRQDSFVALRHQLDQNFDSRYSEFKEAQKSYSQQSIFSILDKPVKPTKMRLEFDMRVCDALGIETDEQELLGLYRSIIDEMLVTQALSGD